MSSRGNNIKRRRRELLVAQLLQGVAVQGGHGGHVDLEVAAAQGRRALAVHVDAELEAGPNKKAKRMGNTYENVLKTW